MIPIRVGDPITFVRDKHIIQTHVEFVSTDQVRAAGTGALLVEEDKTWLRGHYMYDAPEVNAARTSRALDPPVPRAVGGSTGLTGPRYFSGDDDDP